MSILTFVFASPILPARFCLISVSPILPAWNRDEKKAALARVRLEFQAPPDQPDALFQDLRPFAHGIELVEVQAPGEVESRPVVAHGQVVAAVPLLETDPH